VRAVSSSAAPARATGRSIDEALAEVAAGASARDHAPAAFPEDAVRALERAGALGFAASLGHRQEWSLVRRIARADGSVGRIVDGHLNGMERLLALAPGPLRAAEMRALAAGSRRIGVWGADPVPGEGVPARLVDGRSGPVVVGAKVFCSGAGGVDRALVTVAGHAGPGLLAYVDVTRGTEIDTSWYAGSGLRTSESHRVLFHAAPVIAVLGSPGELVREPWFSRDAIRTAACWAGIADRAADAALDAMAARGRPGELDGLAAGRILGALAGIDRWLESAAVVAGDPGADLADTSVMLRAAVSEACRAVIDAGARALGSRPYAAGGDLDRCRRDLELFLLQHRLDPMVARLGMRELARRAV
jgi:hypothetical protein